MEAKVGVVCGGLVTRKGAGGPVWGLNVSEFKGSMTRGLSLETGLELLGNCQSKLPGNRVEMLGISLQGNRPAS